MKIGILKNSTMCYNSLNFFGDRIKEALEKAGVQTEILSNFREDIQRGPWDAIIGINAGIFAKYKDGSFIIDDFHCPIFEIIVDHPYVHHNILEEHTDNLHIVCLGEDHVKYIQTYYRDFKTVQMGVLSGPAERTSKEWKKRRYDVVFSGSINDEQRMRKNVTEVIQASWAEKIFDFLVDHAMRYPVVPLDEAMIKGMQHLNISCNQEDVRILMHYIGVWVQMTVRTRMRVEMIKRLDRSGICVAVAGNGWDKLEGTFSNNIQFLGAVDFAETGRLMANAKVVLNLMPFDFKNGIHDRIITAMMNGAVCVTDSNPYLKNHFTDGKDIIFYDLERMDELGGKIKEIIKNEQKAEYIADCGKKIARTNYTWDRFVDKHILSYLR